MMTTAWRYALLLSLTLFTGGCQLVADIFQGGIVVGVIIVLLILGVIGFIMSRMRGR